MEKSNNQERVDALIDQFWQRGYLTVSRRYGKYLPDPDPIGNYKVDAVAKYKRKIAIGIILQLEDLNDPKIISKLNFLATNHTKYSSKKVTLFIGVPEQYTLKANMLIAGLDEIAKKNIKIVGIPDKSKQRNI